MKAKLFELLLNLGVPVVVGMLTPALMDAIKRHVPVLASARSETQRVAVVMLAAFGNALATLTGVTLGADPALWTEAELHALISSSIAFAVHAADRAKLARADAAVSAEVAAAARAAAAGALAREYDAAGVHPMAVPEPAVPAPAVPAPPSVER